MNKIVKIFNRKIPLGLCISAAFLSAAVAYSVSYNLAMHRFNQVVSYNYEKQQMYSKLSEVDHAIRQEYIGDIDEEYLINGICNGYAEGIKEDNCKYYSSSEYKEYISSKNQSSDSVRADKMGDVGYLKIFNLDSDSANLFIRCVQDLQTDGIHKFAIDLRGVSGGDSNELAKIINFLLPEGATVSYINKSGDKEVEFKSTSSEFDDDVVMICDKDTSGLAEVLISAVKDFERAKIVGEKTAGKAVKLNTMQLSDGSAVIFPVGHYINKDGISVYKTGVEPDIEATIDEQALELLKINQLDFNDDVQILAAIDLLN